MISASSRALTGSPSPRWLTSQLWQNWQSRLHQEIKIAPDPRWPGQRRFLPKMGKGGRHHQLVASLAQAELAAATLHPAISWAQRAGAQQAAPAPQCACCSSPVW